MGLFGNKEACALCDGKTSALTSAKLQDGTICGTCMAGCSSLIYGSLKYKTVADIAAHLQYRARNAEDYILFTPTDGEGKLLQLNRTTKTWCCPSSSKRTPDLFSFSDLLEFELTEDGKSITKGGLGSAVVGGLVFGGVGAIVGGGLGKKQKDLVTSMAINITVRNDSYSLITIPLITAETKRGGFVYKVAKQQGTNIIALLNVIADSAERVPAPAPAAPQEDVASQLVKFKELCDAGIITEEEFTEKKKQLLGI